MMNHLRRLSTKAGQALNVAVPKVAESHGYDPVRVQEGIKIFTDKLTELISTRKDDSASQAPSKNESVGQTASTGGTVSQATTTPSSESVGQAAPTPPKLSNQQIFDAFQNAVADISTPLPKTVQVPGKEPITETNAMVRETYNHTVKVEGPAKYPAQEFEEGPPDLAGDKMKHYGNNLAAIRHGARMAGRAFMTDKQEVRALEVRDIEIYKNPKGPTYEQARAKAGGAADEYVTGMNLYYRSQQTDPGFNQKAGLSSVGTAVGTEAVEIDGDKIAVIKPPSLGGSSDS